MKKKFFYSALFLMGMAFTGFTAASCSDDNDNTARARVRTPAPKATVAWTLLRIWTTMRKTLPVGATIRSK